MRRVVSGLIFLTIVLSIWGGMHYLVWTHVARNTGLPGSERAGIAVLLAALAASTFISLLRVLPRALLERLWTPSFLWAGFVFMLFFLFLFADFGFGMAGLASSHLKSPESARLEALVVLAAGVVLGVVAWLGARRDAPIKRIEVILEKLPAALSGFSIVQLSDVHVAPDTDPARIQGIVDRVNAQSPDLIALTGDLVDGTPELLREGVAPFAGLRAKHGVFFVTGNHEYFSGGDRWIETFRALGFRILQNERVPVGRGADTFDLAGVPDWGGGSFGAVHRPRLADVLQGREQAREVVLLAHQPKQFEEAAALDVGLQLSGHTHGGQIWPFTWLIHLAEKRVAGLFRVGRSQLYVSKGTGFWGPPMRLGAPTEITHITLRADHPPTIKS